MNYLLKIVIILFLASFIQKNDIRKLTYEAYLSGSETFWKNAVSEAEARFESVSSNEHMYQLALARFGLLNATMVKENEDLFDEYVDETMELLEKLEKRNYKAAEALALRASIYGYKIAFSPLKGMYLGPKNTALIDKAIALNPNSPIVQKMYAQHQYFTPEMWGGDIENAKRAFEESIRLFEKEDDKRNWMYLDNHAWLGIIHKKQENLSNAREVWEKALAYEPDFKWVGEVLMPSID